MLQFPYMKAISSAKGPTNRLSDRIRLARRAAHFSQVALAAQTGVTASAVAQWEQTQGTAPRLATLRRVALATSVSFEWLATGAGRASERRTTSAKETLAVTLDTFAQDLAEETLLVSFRKLTHRDRLLVLQLFESLGRRR